MKNADLVMLCYDISNRESFSKLSYWCDLMRKNNNKSLKGKLSKNRSFVGHQIRSQVIKTS